MTPARIPSCLFVALLLVAGCTPSTHRECLRQADCRRGELCRIGTCRPVETHLDADARKDGFDPIGPDSGFDAAIDTAPTVPCPDYRAPAPGDLIINELLADPPSGPEGDANGDGVRDASDDEFVEIVNVSGSGLFVGGVTLLEGGDPAHSFAPTCLDRLDAVVFWGGVLDGASLPDRPGVHSMVASGSFGLTNGGGRLELRSAAGDSLDTAVWTSGPSESQVRTPDLTGESRVVHSQATGSDGAVFSPGSCVDGSPFEEGCPGPR